MNVLRIPARHRAGSTAGRRLAAGALAGTLVLGAAAAAHASSVDESIVDATAPTGAVSVAAGAAAVGITINLAVTGKQDGTATFQVNRDFTLSGGTFTGLNPQTFTVAPQAAGTTTTFSTTGTITVASGQGAGTYTLSVGALNITNTNSTGAKLGAGTSSTYAVTVTAPPSDTTPPALNLPADIVTEATGPAGAAVSYTATATDAKDGPVAVTCDPASGATFPIATTTVNCSAKDAANNTATGSFTVKVQDTTGPQLTVPGTVTAEATGPSGAAVDFAASVSATDDVDGVRTVTCLPASGSTFPLGTTTVNCSATDTRSNTGTGSFDVVVRDTTAPTLTLPADLAGEATGPSGAPVTFTATANDLVDGSVPVTCTPASGSTFPIDTTTVSCSAEDSRHNTATGSFRVTVGDTTPPKLDLPADITREATGPSGAAVTYSATASDLVDGPVSVTCSPASGSTFAIATTTVGCSAADSRTNTANGSFTITVQDTTAPSLTLPGNIVAEATGPTGAAVSFAASASDLVDGVTAVSCTPASGSTFALGETTVNCSSTDAHGNKAEGSFSVTVVDTTAPTLNTPANQTLEATGPSGAVATFTATATDLVDGSVTPVCTPASGSTFALGATTVTCTATDAAANKATGTFTVTVVDTTAPSVVVPANITASATSAAGAAVTYTASATDLVDGSITPTCTQASGSTFALGTTTVTCSATDTHGNTGSGTFSVTVTVPWSNFLQPINTNGSSVFKQGSTVPVKFQLTGSAAGVSTLVAKLYVAKLDSGILGTDAEAISTSAADSGNTFRYDATGGIYIFNLNTKPLTAGTYQLRADLGDGLSHTVLISLKK